MREVYKLHDDIVRGVVQLTCYDKPQNLRSSSMQGESALTQSGV